jgi:putative protease
MGEEKKVGTVEHYFTRIGVAAIKIINGEIAIGDEIRIKGSTTDFLQRVESMEINKESVERAGVGSSIGIKVKERVREGDLVYKVEEG